MENFRFTYQENQFNGECLPCTLTQFMNIVKSENVAWRISTRQAVEQALALGLSLDLLKKKTAVSSSSANALVPVSLSRS